MHEACLDQFRVVAELLELNQSARFALEKRVSRLEGHLEMLFEVVADLAGQDDLRWTLAGEVTRGS